MCSAANRSSGAVSSLRTQTHTSNRILLPVGHGHTRISVHTHPRSDSSSAASVGGQTRDKSASRSNGHTCDATRAQVSACTPSPRKELGANATGLLQGATRTCRHGTLKRTARADEKTHLPHGPPHRNRARPQCHRSTCSKHKRHARIVLGAGAPRTQPTPSTRHMIGHAPHRSRHPQSTPYLSHSIQQFVPKCLAGTVCSARLLRAGRGDMRPASENISG